MGKSAFYKCFKRIGDDKTIYRARPYNEEYKEGILVLCGNLEKQCEQPLSYYENWWIVESPRERTDDGFIKYTMLTPYEFENEFTEFFYNKNINDEK